MAKFEKPRFLSEKQFQEHLKLYEGYFKKSADISKKFEKVNLEDANATQGDVRSLALGETFVKNAVRLHEYYFENLAKGKTEPKGRILKLLERFGGFSAFKKGAMALALSVRGWVVLAWDSEHKHLHLFGTDQHDIAVWNATPILVLDVYEHAYFMDFGTNRKAYVEAFFENIDWNVVNKRLETV